MGEILSDKKWISMVRFSPGNSNEMTNSLVAMTEEGEIWQIKFDLRTGQIAEYTYLGKMPRK